VDRITRKELKQDRFAQEVSNTIDFLGEHRQQAIRIGVTALVVVLAIVAVFVWRGHQHRVRQQALASALEIQNAPVGEAELGLRTFPTADAKEAELQKAFSDVASRYAGTDEGLIAQYYLGAMAADKGDLAQAEKQFREVAERGRGNYASLASMALAETYAAQGKTADAEKVLRNVMARPTDFVSKEQAQLALGRLLASSNPAEARKLLEPLQKASGAVSDAASLELEQLSASAK